MMANINNIFAGVLCFIIVWGLFYLMYPTLTDFAEGMPTEIRVFSMMVLLGVLILGGLFMPIQMVLADDKGTV